MSINSVGSHKGDSGDYVTDTRRKGREITIFVAARRNGRYEARIGEKGRPLCVSTKPFVAI